MKKVLIVSPSITKSFGGMVTVVKQILDSKYLKTSFSFSTYFTYIDGFALKRVFYSTMKCIKYVFAKPWKNNDIVHFHMASNMSTTRAMFMSKPLIKYKIPYVVHVHGADFDDYLVSLKPRKQARVISFLSKSKAVIVLSDYWKSKLFSLTGLKNLVVVENSIDSIHYNNFNCVSLDGTPHFLFLGRVCQRKGAWDVFEAIKKLDEQGFSFSFVYAGDGENDKLDKLVKDAGLGKSVKVVGWADQQKKEQLLSSSQILVLPSYREGLPMSILESMASGKVIVSSYAGAIPEVVQEGTNGYLVNAGNVDELILAMKKCFDVKENTRIGENNIKLISERFNIETFERNISDIYNA